MELHQKSQRENKKVKTEREDFNVNRKKQVCTTDHAGDAEAGEGPLPSGQLPKPERVYRQSQPVLRRVSVRQGCGGGAATCAGAALKGTIQDSEGRIARLLFKLAVEVNILMNILAAELNTNENTLQWFREQYGRGGMADRRKYHFWGMRYAIRKVQM